MKNKRASQVAAPTSPPADLRAYWPAALFVALAACYLALFFSAWPERAQRLLLVFAPDDLATSWVGGNWGRFAMFDRLPILAAAAFILAVGHGAGRLLLAALRADQGLTRLETAVFSFGAGLNMLSLYTLAIGLFGGLHHGWLFIGPACAVLLGWTIYAGIPFVVPPSGGRYRLKPELQTMLGAWGLLLGLPFVLVIVLGGMLPPWEFDVREYHLQVPKEWYQAGRIDFLPHNVYGNMPLGAEMHSIAGMMLMPGESNWWLGALVGKTVMAAFAPLTALALFAAGKRMFGEVAGVVAALVFISIPWIVQVSINGLNEGACAFYWLTAAYAAWLWTKRNDSRWGQLLLAGFLAGGAVACKYPAVLFVVAPLAGWVLLSRRFPKRSAELTAEIAGASPGLRHQPPDMDSGSHQPADALGKRLGFIPLALFLVATAAGCGLWFAKNAVLTGNPTYPLLYSVFDGHTRTPEKDQQWRKAHAPGKFTASDLVDKLSRFAWRSEFVSPLLVPLGALAFFYRPFRRDVLLLAGYLAFVLAAWWLLTHRLDRFWVPVLPFAALLAGAGLCWTDRWLRRCAVAILVGGLVANFLIVSLPAFENEPFGDTRFFVSLESLRLDEAATPNVPSRVHPAHRYLNRAVPEGNRVLLVGDAQPFDVEVPVLYNTCFDDCLFETLLRGKSRDERLAAFRAHHISHVYIAWSEIARYRSRGNYGFTDWVTAELVHDELVAEQGLLKKVDIELPRERGEMFEVLIGLERSAEIP